MMMLSFNNFFPPEVLTFISDRTINFLLAENQTDLDEQQKEFLSAQLGFNLPPLINIRQMHGKKIICATENYKQNGESVGEADGVVTNVGQLPIAVRTADCLPIFIYDSRHACIALIHSGWRGSQQHIAVGAINLMHNKVSSEPKDIQVAFGPAIRSCCYKVGKEFDQYFPEMLIKRDGDWYLDLPEVNRKQLLNSGIKEENIFDCSICTCCDKNYFSYRREGKDVGRIISLMMLRDV